jgi:ribosomal protein L11 methyltransferase
MAWVEVSVRVNREAAEAVAEVLSRYVPEGVVLDFSLPAGPLDDAQSAVEQATQVTVKAYLAVDEETETRKQRIAEGLWHLHQIWSVIPEPTFRAVPDQDWNALWKAQIPILRLGRNIVIKPSWRDFAGSEDDVVLEMDPGMAFGTGLHPTTQLCVTATEDLVKPGDTVLDLGTGTGILAMIAAKLGAARVVAVDNDADAIAAARHNIEANHLSQMITLRNGSLQDVAESYDLVLANILAPIIIQMASAGLAARLRPEGHLVASGILAEQTQAVVEALEEVGLQVIRRHQQEEWMALIAVRTMPKSM